MDFAKLDAQKLVLSPTPFDPSQLCASAVELLRPAAKARSIALSLELSPALPPGLLGDDARLRQVLVNLIGNAVKFTEQGAVEVDVATRAIDATNCELTVRVKDSGIGISPEAVGRLFRPYEQADEGMSRRYGGSGLGLTISRQIILAMGGDIHVQSEPGRGSVFSFAVSLPVAAALLKSARLPAGAAPVPTARRPLAILVVDDHALNREVAYAKLSGMGHRVDLASDGSEAIDAVGKQDYDAVFMDLQMPGMSGIEVTQRITEAMTDKPPPYVIALTASVYEEDRAACVQAGMRDFIAKPISAAQLEAVLARVAAERIGPSSRQPEPGALAPQALEKLRQIERAGDAHFVARVCAVFVADARKRLRTMRESFDRADAKGLEQDAHILRSASATVGATAMAELCDRIERQTREGDLSPVGAWLDALAAAFPEVERALSRLPFSPDLS